MKHQLEIKVRGFHLDVYQHVNNARYLEFLEEARWAFLETTGELDHFQSLGLAWVIVNININYRSAATMGQTLVINTELGQIGRKSAVFSQTITEKATGALVSDADITFVILEPKTGKPIAIEGELRERLTAYLASE